MLVSMKEMLLDADQKGYAVGCFNAVDLTMARGVIEAAEAENAPVILCHAELHCKYTPLAKIAPILIEEAKNANVPVSVLLDHGKKFESIMQAIHLGFNAVMFDGSHLEYSENVRQTAEIVRIAHTLGVTVEAELGQVARPKSGGADGEDDDSTIFDTSGYTDPERSGAFVEKTGIDCLAAAFGTVHGVYLAEPSLDIVRLKEIHRQCGVPVVMHGGSGLSEADFKECIQNGVSKINYYTNMALQCAQDIQKRLQGKNEKVFYHTLMMWSIESIAANVREAIRMFGSSKKA
ncbi:MAG: class II fructose-bisphosphate aldolase [Spirochaetales bacterium]|nr:class II fructose-bisphosphate aldolase [Spirochaetales bacterium]